MSSNCNVYKVELYSLCRMAELFGRQFLVRGFSTGDRLLIAPRARVKESWSPAGKKDLPEVLTVGANKDDYVAILNIFAGSDWAWIYRFKENERCRILGLDVQGAYGMFPKSLLEIVTPIQIKFSDPSFL